MTKPILCDRCKVPIGEIDKGMVFAYDNYNVCENCGAEVCGLHCVEAAEDYWVCSECERVAKTTLDEVIEIQKTLIGAGKTYDWVAERMYKWLTELRDRRESELRPATKFLGNSLKEQWKHIRSEQDEVRLAYWSHTKSSPGPGVTFIKNNLIEELIDLQMSCETMLAILDLNEQQRNEARRKVIAKNAERGYYKETL